MQANLDPSNFDALQQYVISIFPDELSPLSVSIKNQKEEISSLRRTIGSERFFFVVDLTSFEISLCDGIQRWLGYYEKDFTLKKYWGLVHPGMQKSAHTVFLQLCNILCTGKFKLAFMVQRYSSLIAIKHYKGHYLLAKRTASVFQYDEQNRLTEYLNEFTIIGKYSDEPLTPTFFTDKGEEETSRGEIVMKQAVEQFIGMKIFSVNELHVARLLAYTPAITQKEIADLLGKSVHTIDTYCKRFSKKSKEFFHIDFPTVKEAALYLQKSGLL